MTPMEELWEQVAKPAADGQKQITYKTDQDLLFLYANGFVDFRKFTLADWIKAFDDSKQKDGSYRVTRQQWLAKDKYRFTGAIGEPFDPQRLKEREYTEQEFSQILKLFICPSTWIPEQNIPGLLDYFKKKKKLVDGKIRIDKDVKKEFQESLDKIPSPLRILQLDVARFRRQKGAAPAATSGSGYQAGTDAQKLAASRLAQIAKSAPAPEPEVGKEAGIPLKEIKKRRPTPGRV